MEQLEFTVIFVAMFAASILVIVVIGFMLKIRQLKIDIDSFRLMSDYFKQISEIHRKRSERLEEEYKNQNESDFKDFLIEKGVTSNTMQVTIFQIMEWYKEYLNRK